MQLMRDVVWVRDVIGSEAVIQTSDQSKWRMANSNLLRLHPNVLAEPHPTCRVHQGKAWRPHQPALSIWS